MPSSRGVAVPSSRGVAAAGQRDPDATLMDTFMNASFYSRAPRLKWQKKLRDALHGRNDSYSATTLTAAAAAARKRESLPKMKEWHVTTQEALISQLRSAVWKDDRRRVMVDLGSHAGHGIHNNVSDAMIWLANFHHSGRVLAVDMIEDYAQDLQQRLEQVWPYSAMTSVVKRSIAMALSPYDGSYRDMFWFARGSVSCCAGRDTPRPWCEMYSERDSRRIDHICGITMRRLGLPFAGNDRALPPSSHSADFFRRAQRGNYSRQSWPPYLVQAARTDTLWRRELGGEHLDFVKVDVDTWRQLGLEGLLSVRALITD